ncbi:uncharacterized protein LOC126989705 [Eriocheir sinensis]|uniref:uncharacterized protein LOC126989705 n=1 Tax=Eriocheir sinensis TaxID=95602 RepID=UPI0021C839F1|nr:uncharacterized protein LOC126989705 [Eriocheir sinensis]
MSSGYQSGGGSNNSLAGGAGGGGVEPGGAEHTTPGIDDDEEEEEEDDRVDNWPAPRALPFPRWGCGRPSLPLSSLPHYESFTARLAPLLREVLCDHPYDTVSNFVRFSESYLAWRGTQSEGGDGRGGGGGGNQLSTFFREYDPPLLPGRHTCVGLTCLLETRMAALETDYPGLKDATYKVGCEEEVQDMPWYCSTSVPPSTCEMEHVLLCVRVCVCGRPGVILLDPGYHVGEPVTVMEDGMEPTSGMVEGGTALCGVERRYRYRAWPQNSAFVEWEVEERRGGGEVEEEVDDGKEEKEVEEGRKKVERKKEVEEGGKVEEVEEVKTVEEKYVEWKSVRKEEEEEEKRRRKKVERREKKKRREDNEEEEEEKEEENEEKEEEEEEEEEEEKEEEEEEEEGKEDHHHHHHHNHNHHHHHHWTRLTNIIYVGQPFLSPLEVAERRNLAYPFKSLVARGGGRGAGAHLWGKVEVAAPFTQDADLLDGLQLLNEDIEEISRLN